MGRTIGITASRSAAAKRGVAANLAAVAALDDRWGRVAVVDTDPASCDVGDRFGTLRTRRLEWPPLTAVPCSPAIRADRADARVVAAQTDHDLVVIDLPLRAGGPGPALDSGLIDRLDRLVVVTDGSAADLDATRRHLELLAELTRRGRLEARLAVEIVVTGPDAADEPTRGDLARRLDVAAVAAVPQWWGSAPANFGFGPTLGFPALDAALLVLVADLAVGARPARRLASVSR